MAASVICARLRYANCKLGVASPVLKVGPDNGEVGSIVEGELNPGQSVTVEILTGDCNTGWGYWTWIVGRSAGSARLSE